MAYREILKSAVPCVLACLVASAAPAGAQTIELVPVGQARIALAADPEGGYVIAWADDVTGVVRYVLLTDGGLRSVILNTELVLDPGGVSALSLAVGTDGNWAVVAETPSGSVAGAIVSPDGDVLATLDLAVPAATRHRVPRVAAVPGGGFVVAWAVSHPDDIELDGTDTHPVYDAWAARFDAAGERVAGPVRVNDFRPSDQVPADLLVGAGRVLVVWDAIVGETLLGEGRARILGLDLEPSSEEIALNPASTAESGQRHFRAGMGADGRFLATWGSNDGERDRSELDLHPDAVRARPFSADGAPLAGESTVNVHTAGFQSLPDLGVTGEGVAWIAWEDEGLIPLAGERPRKPRVVARPFTLDGLPLGGERLLAEELDLAAHDLQVVGGRSGALAAWRSEGFLYAALLGGGPEPPEIAPPDEFALTSLELPGFRVWVRITAAGPSIWGVQEPLCIPETLCASGALPGRTEVLVRVVGPKGNGFFWPTLVKLTTSRVEVWLEQTSTGEVQHYVLPGASPGNDVLNGLFDRDGFRP